MADYGKLNFAVAFNPTTAFPLDARTLFYSYDDALAAAVTAKRAGSSESVYYYGMRLTVVNEEAQTARQYIIQPGGRLLGVAMSGDSSGGSVDFSNLGDSLTIDPDTGKVEVATATSVTADGSLPVTGAAVAEYVEDAIEDSLGTVEDLLAEV